MKNMILVFVTILFSTPLKSLGGDIILLDEMQSKAINISFEHFRDHEDLDSFKTMITDYDENIEITFYNRANSGETRGGGEKQIIYNISKTDFTIKSINRNHGK